MQKKRTFAESPRHCQHALVKTQGPMPSWDLTKTPWLWRHFLGSLFLKRTFPLVTVVAFAWLKLRKTRVAEAERYGETW